MTHNNGSDHAAGRLARTEHGCASEDAVKQLPIVHEIRQQLVDGILAGATLMAVVGVPVSVSRSLSTGWLGIYSIHVAIGMVVVAVFAARKRLPLSVKVAVVMMIFWAVGVAGTISLGLLGGGIWWLSMSTFVISVFSSLRSGLMAMLAVVATIMLIGHGYASGQLTLGFDPQAYISTYSAWLSILVSAVMLPLVVFGAFSRYQSALARAVAQAEQQRAANELLASHDPLTGLPRASVFDQRLEQILAGLHRRNDKHAILFIDLDGFKAINDQYGHEVGDHVLRTVADRMRQLTRHEDTIARKGGDEFVAMFCNVPGVDMALEIGQKLLAEIAKPIVLGELSVQVGSSIGIAIAPDHSRDAKELLRLADMAMYQAKRDGKYQARIAHYPQCERAPSTSRPHAPERCTRPGRGADFSTIREF